MIRTFRPQRRRLNPSSRDHRFGTQAAPGDDATRMHPYKTSRHASKRLVAFSRMCVCIARMAAVFVSILLKITSAEMTTARGPLTMPPAKMLANDDNARNDFSSGSRVVMFCS